MDIQKQQQQKRLQQQQQQQKQQPQQQQQSGVLGRISFHLKQYHKIAIISSLIPKNWRMHAYICADTTASISFIYFHHFLGKDLKKCSIIIESPMAELLPVSS